MNSVDRDLDRLLKAAASAPARPVDALSLAVERRVLAEWRTARASVTDWTELVAVFRRGLAFATLVAVAAVVLTFQGTPRDESYDFAATTEAALELALR